MAEFNGKFQYQDSKGNVTQEGACRIHFDEQTLTLTPASGIPTAADLGDLDAVIAADYEIRLPLYTGNTIVLRQLAKTYDNLAKDLLEAYRKRAVQCLLLEDFQEIDRFTGNFAIGQKQPAPAEFRLYKSNLAVLPIASQSFQWRLADLDSVRFDDAAYEVVLECGSDRLRVSKLAKRTEEFATRVQDALSSVATQSVQALHSAFPFLNPDQLRESASLLREGRSAIVANLDAIHPKFSTALASNAVDQNLKPYFDELIGRTAKDQLHAGFKLIRAEDGEELAADETADESGGDVSTALDADKTGPPTLYWFFFPIARRPGSSEVANLVAWEASSASGRATYFFRLIDPARVSDLRDAHVSEAAVRRLNRVLGMLNFHRRPIYLSDDELALDPKFRRYAIAARRMPEVREVRANFLGRAIHSSVDAWKDQFDAILKKSAD